MTSAVLFPGQGSHHIGMGEALFARSSAARLVFEQADEQLGFKVSTLCFSGPEAQLTDTVYQQPALFTTGIAAWQALRELSRPLPQYVAGHSLGELTALVAAGSISFADGLSLVKTRGQLMKEAGERSPGAMAAILALDAATVTDVCQQAAAETGGVVQLANDNCPGQTVISGDEASLTRALELAKAAGARKLVRLPITIAAHSGLMASASEAFSQAVDETVIIAPDIEIIGNVTAVPLRSAAEVRAELKAQLTSPVNWTASMRYLLAQGTTTFIEAGPGDVLLGLLKRIDRRAERIKFQLPDI